MTAATPPAYVAPAAPVLPAACSLLPPWRAGRALGRPVNALSAALLGENDATRASHAVNCVYSYDRAPYPVALTITVAPPAGERPATFVTDSRGGGVLTVHDRRFELTLWTPDFADRSKLDRLADAALGDKEAEAPKEPAPRPSRPENERYACEILSPAAVSRIAATSLSASAAAGGECQYASLAPPYRVVVRFSLEAKPPGTAFARQRIDELRESSDVDVRSVPRLPYGHFVRPARGLGALLLFDAGTALVTLTTPDSSDRGRLERLADVAYAALGR